VETCGRLWVLVTPSSANNHATGFEVIEAARSACRVRVPGSMLWCSRVSWITRWANVADSRYATIQPPTYRLKMSRITYKEK